MRKTIQVALLILVTTVFCRSNIFAEGIGSANVKFGQAQDGSCDGKGVCMLSSTTSSGGEGMVNVKFTLLEDASAGFYTLTMQFNISEMSSADHDYLYQHFLYSDGEPRPKFLFQSNYTITDRDLCHALNINIGSLTITPESTAGGDNIDKLNDENIRLTYIIAKPKKK